MKRNTVTELSDCWIVNGVTEIKKDLSQQGTNFGWKIFYLTYKNFKMSIRKTEEWKHLRGDK